jgi:hypothetical protein
MKFADVFIRVIDTLAETVVYEVRDKDTGNLVEPTRLTKYVINDATGIVHFDMREIPVEMFNYISMILKCI